MKTPRKIICISLKRHNLLLLFLVLIFFHFNRAHSQQLTFSDPIILIEENDPFTYCYPYDLDGDDDKDWIFFDGGYGNLNLKWRENLNGFEEFGNPNVIASNIIAYCSLFVDDLDMDGDNDILLGSGENADITWYKNIDGLGNFILSQSFEDLGPWYHSAICADMEGDGDNDIFAHSDYTDEILFYENIDGSGTFSDFQILNAQNVERMEICDVDGDDDMDIVSIYNNYNPKWHENLDGHGNYGPSQSIPCDPQITGISCKDCDNDGDLDIITSFYEGFGIELTWIENMDGLGGFGNQQLIGYFDEDLSLGISDLDTDGDLDLLEGSSSNNTLGWYENTNGLGNLGSVQIITTNEILTSGYHCIDLDEDGDNDVLATDLSNSLLGWFRNDGIISSINPIENKHILNDNITNYPNPFNTSTTIEFEITQQGDVRIEILDIYGQILYEILDEPLTAGIHKIPLDKNNLQRGILFLKITFGRSIQYHKMIAQ